MDLRGDESQDDERRGTPLPAPPPGAPRGLGGIDVVLLGFLGLVGILFLAKRHFLGFTLGAVLAVVLVIALVLVIGMLDSPDRDDDSMGYVPRRPVRDSLLFAFFRGFVDIVLGVVGLILGANDRDG